MCCYLCVFMSQVAEVAIAITYIMLLVVEKGGSAAAGERVLVRCACVSGSTWQQERMVQQSLCMYKP